MSLDPDGDEYWPDDDPRWLGEPSAELKELEQELGEEHIWPPN